MTIVQQQKRTADPAALLMELEKTHVGGTTLTPQEREQNPILLLQERESVLAQVAEAQTEERTEYQTAYLTAVEMKELMEKHGDRLEEAAFKTYAANKLAEAGVFWHEGEMPPETQEGVFLEDRNPGLSELERDLVETQAWIFFHSGSIYESPVLSAGDLALLRREYPDEHQFMSEVLQKAAEVDDIRDAGA